MRTTARWVGMGCGVLALAAAIIWLCTERRGTTVPPAAPLKLAVPEPVGAVLKPIKKAQPPVAEVSVPVPKDSRTDALKREIGKLNVSEPVRTLIGLGDPVGDFAERAAALKKLTQTLSHDDAQALTMFLDFRFGEQDQQSRLNILEFEGLKNDALSVLLEQKRFPEGLGGQLVAMYRDTGHAEVWRIYCVQYFGEYYQRKWPVRDEPVAAGPVAEEDPKSERCQMERAYRNALAEKNSQMAGTALLSLEELSRKYARFDRTRVEEDALALATDDACHETSRISALLVCGKMGCKNALPTARMLAQTGQSVVLRAAAIATVGDLGDQADLELIESLRNASDARLRGAAESALARLRKRVG